MKSRNLFAKFGYGLFEDRSVYSLSLMIFFWSIFDSIMSYITPILITQKGFSNTEMGIIYGTSSLAGAVFDVILARLLKNTNFRRLFLFLMIISAMYPLLLWNANDVALLVLCMAVWGLYYDIFNFGILEFVGKFKDQERHSKNFGIINLFKSLGTLIAPFFIGLIVGDVIGAEPFVIGFGFVIVSAILYLIFANISYKDKLISNKKERTIKRNMAFEMKYWFKIARRILPVLLFVMMIYIIEATYWTVVPLLSEEFEGFEDFGGLFLSISLLPILLTGWFVPTINKFVGKKRTAYLSLGIACVLLISFFFINEPFLLLGLNFVAAIFTSIALPSIEGLFGDYLAGSNGYDNEIIGVQDFSVNIGYIIGPMIAGFISENFGNLHTIAIVGVVGVILIFFLLIFTSSKDEVKLSFK